jgi:transposase-like protein
VSHDEQAKRMILASLRPGESLVIAARRFKISVASLQRWVKEAAEAAEKRQKDEPGEERP